LNGPSFPAGGSFSHSLGSIPTRTSGTVIVVTCIGGCAACLVPSSDLERHGDSESRHKTESALSPTRRVTSHQSWSGRHIGRHKGSASSISSSDSFSGLDALLANGGLSFLTSGNNDSPANPSTFPHWLIESSGNIEEVRPAEPLRARASQLPSLKEMSSAVHDQNRPAPPPPRHNGDVALAKTPSRSCRDGSGSDDSASGRRAQHTPGTTIHRRCLLSCRT
jgi:hypothetical protein